MPLTHVAPLAPLLAISSSTGGDIAETVTAYTCDTDAALCRLVDQFTDDNWVLAVTDLLVARPLSIVVIVAVALLARALARRAITRFTMGVSAGTVPQRFRFRDKGQTGLNGAVSMNERRRQRAETIGGVLRSIASAVIFTIAGIMILDEFGIPVGPIIASAGIIGVALGFGSQALVKDFLSGIFMLMEDQYGVGDVIDTGEATGTVEAVGLRTTRLRDVNGAVWYVRNGEILRIGNHSQGWARAVVDIPAPYGQDIDRMATLIKTIVDDMWQDDTWNEDILEEPEVWGVEQLAADSVVMRVACRTAPLKQWAVARELRRRVKVSFDREGIEIPLPQRTVWLRHEGDPSPESTVPDGSVGPH